MKGIYKDYDTIDTSRLHQW